MEKKRGAQVFLELKKNSPQIVLCATLPTDWNDPIKIQTMDFNRYDSNEKFMIPHQSLNYRVSLLNLWEPETD
jgi:hypothetical protein